MASPFEKQVACKALAFQMQKSASPLTVAAAIQLTAASPARVATLAFAMVLLAQERYLTGEQRAAMVGYFVVERRLSEADANGVLHDDDS